MVGGFKAPSNCQDQVNHRRRTEKSLQKKTVNEDKKTQLSFDHIAPLITSLTDIVAVNFSKGEMKKRFSTGTGKKIEKEVELEKFLRVKVISMKVLRLCLKLMNVEFGVA
jgi:hypothetical protein